MFDPDPDGIRFKVKLTPKAGRTCLDGTMIDGGGDVVFKIAVSAVPENNKANQALIDFLAKSLKIPKTTIHLLSGATHRYKILFLSGNPDHLGHTLREWARHHG